MKSKTIILSSEKQQGRGILTIYQEEGLLQCRIRLYNIEKPNRFCKIGIYHEKKVYSANLLDKNGVYTSSIVGSFDIDQDFYCAIINTNNNNEVLLSGGTYAGFFFNDNSVFENANITKENPNTNLYKYNEDLQSFNNETNINSENNIANQKNLHNDTTNKNDCINNCEKCKNCVYKEYFYSQNNSSAPLKQTENTSYQNQNYTLINKNINPEDSYYSDINNEDFKTNNFHKEENSSVSLFDEKPNKNEEIENNQQTEHNINDEQNENLGVLSAIIPQFKYVFENYPQDEILCNLIPNSKFVKINENKEQFSIGAIYDEDEMKYICYAVLCNYNSPAPQELGEHYQWLPLDKEDPLSEGYYIVFQDAQDLNIVEL